MARNSDSIQIGFDVDAESLKAAIAELKQEIDSIRSASKRLNDEDTKRVNILKEQVKALDTQEKALNKVRTQSQQVGTSLARIVQDVPFGIVGIGNNITFLAEQLANIQTQAKIAGQSLTAFQILGQGVTQLFTSPVGLISLLVTAATVFGNAFKPAVEAATKALTELTDSLGITDTKFAKFVEGYKERVKDLIKINKQSPIPFAPRSADEIKQEILRYEQALRDIDTFIQSKQRDKIAPTGSAFSFLNLLFSNDEINKLKKRREILSVELNALKESLTEFEVAQQTVLGLRAQPTVEVGKPFVNRQITKFDEQIITSTQNTLSDVVKRLRTTQPERTPIAELSTLTITQLELAIDRLTKDIKNKGDLTLVPRLKAFKQELDRKLVEAGLKETKSETPFAPSFIGFNRLTLEKLAKEEASTSNRLGALVSPVPLSEAQPSATESQFLRQQSIIARATQLYSLAREAAAQGQTTTAEQLISEADNELAKLGIPPEPIRTSLKQQFSRDIIQQSPMFQFGVGLAQQVGESLAQIFLVQQKAFERERELNLERLRLARIDNDRMIMESRRAYEQRVLDAEFLLASQQITEEEFNARKQAALEERQRQEEEYALKVKELALQEEQLRAQQSQSVLRQTIANATNYALEFVFRSLLNDKALWSLGVFGVIAAAVLAPILIASLTSIIRGKVASYASGGVVKKPTLAIVGDATKSNNRTNEEAIFNERLLTRQAERFAAMVSSPVIILNGRKMNDELARSERLADVVKVK